jgi:hypothetical protein
VEDSMNEKREGEYMKEGKGEKIKKIKNKNCLQCE